MKKSPITFVLLFLLSAKLFSQEPTVEKSIWGIQIIKPPFALYNETKLYNNIALRTELNFGLYYENAGESWAVFPSLHAEPRYYYNLKRRLNKNKRIDGNSANFLSLVCGYQPPFAIKSKDTRVNPSLYFIPTYGLKRKIGKHFNFEFAFGIGYSIAFKENIDWLTQKESKYTKDYLTTSLRLAFGFNL